MPSWGSIILWNGCKGVGIKTRIGHLKLFPPQRNEFNFPRNGYTYSPFTAYLYSSILRTQIMSEIIHIRSVAEVYRFLHAEKPSHPLITAIRRWPPSGGCRVLSGRRAACGRGPVRGVDRGSKRRPRLRRLDRDGSRRPGSCTWRRPRGLPGRLWRPALQLDAARATVGHASWCIGSVVPRGPPSGGSTRWIRAFQRCLHQPVGA